MVRRFRRGSLPSARRLTAVAFGWALLAAHGGWAVAPTQDAGGDASVVDPLAGAHGEPGETTALLEAGAAPQAPAQAGYPAVLRVRLGVPGTPASTKAPAAQRGQVGARAVPSEEVRLVHGTVLRTGDAGGSPFVIIDKRGARLWLYDAAGRPLGDTPVLLGSARGDHTVPGVGDKPLEALRPEERTTPAGRFVAMSGMSARGEQVWWVDYDAAVSMHRVLTTNPAERRQARLDSATIADNRVSAGCINLPRRFYETVLHPALEGRRPVVYVLPETREVRAWLAEMAPRMGPRTRARAEARALPVDAAKSPR